MKNLVIATTLSILFLVFVLPAVLAMFIKLVPSADQPGYNVDYKKGIYQKFSVTQKFTAQKENLAAIGLTLGNPNLKNKKDVNLVLYDDKNTLVRSSKLNGFNIPDGAFVKFVFEPVPDSKDKTYTFTLETPQAGDIEVINIFFTKDIPDWAGELKYGEETIDGVLPFVTFHKPQSKLSVVKDIYLGLLKRMVGAN